MTRAAVPKRRGITLTQQIFIGLAIGLALGAYSSFYHPEYAQYYRPFSQLFLRLIKMIIAPLVFSTVVAGIANTGDAKTVGRIGVKALAWFITASLVSLVLGMTFANLFQPACATGRR